MEIFTAKRVFQGKEIVLYGLDSGHGVYAVVVGGDRPHAGASAVADPCEINGKITASLSSVALPGHKDDELCRTLAKRFSVRLGCPAVVSGGIHFDGLGTSSIGKILELADELGEAFLDYIREKREARHG